MPRTGTGTFNLLTPYNPVAPLTTIATTWANNTLVDIASALTDSVAADGQTTMRASLNLGGNRIINLGTPVLDTDAVNYGDYRLGVGASGNWPISAASLTGLGAGQVPFGVTATTSAGDGNFLWDNVAKRLQLTGSVKLQQGVELFQNNSVALTGTVSINVNNGALVFYTTAATGNFIFNLTGSGAGTTVNTLANIIPLNHSLTVTILTTQGASAFYATAVQIDGAAQTVRWQGPTAPSFGNANSIDVYTISVLKTAATPTYSVIASRTQFSGSTAFS